jgi:hypothetical protein
MRTIAIRFLATLAFMSGCTTETTPSDPGAERSPIGKADQTGSCRAGDEDFCGGQSDGNCWCDDECEAFGDCCSDKPVACDGVEPAFCADGDIELTQSFAASSDGKECSVDEQHCVTRDFLACPQLSPLPPDFCADGQVVRGDDSYIASADGMECAMPSVHCVTNDHGACPQFSPLPPDFCADGEIVTGPPRFIASADGKECQLPSVHCVTKDADACEPDAEFCEDGSIQIEEVFVAGDDAFECVAEQPHCVTNDGSACPQLSPLPPDFCREGEVVAGEPHYVSAADGMECSLPSVHCVTKDFGACPQLSPLPPDFCAEGKVMTGPSSFIASVDGMECELPSVHCVSADDTSCES